MTVKYLGDSSTFEDTGPRDVVLVCQYTPTTTAGTYTIKTSPGVFFGFTVAVFGTAPTVYALDGTNTLCGTFTGTAAPQVFSPFPGNLGSRFYTNLLVVTGGTSNGINVLWD